MVLGSRDLADIAGLPTIGSRRKDTEAVSVHSHSASWGSSTGGPSPGASTECSVWTM